MDEKTSQKFAKYMRKYNVLYKNLARITQENLLYSLRDPLIVDIGIGPGLLSIEINKLIPNANIIGIDPSIEIQIYTAIHNFNLTFILIWNYSTIYLV